MRLLVTNSSGFLTGSNLLKKSLCRVAYCCALGEIGVVGVDKCIDLPCFPAAGCLKNKVTGWEKKDLRVLVLRKGGCMNHLWSGCLQLCSCQFSAAYNKTCVCLEWLWDVEKHRFVCLISASTLSAVEACCSQLVLCSCQQRGQAGLWQRWSCPLETWCWAPGWSPSAALALCSSRRLSSEPGFPLHPQHARTLPAPFVCVCLTHHLKEQLKMMSAVFWRAGFGCWCSGAACCTLSPIPALLWEPVSFIYLVVVSLVSVCLICCCSFLNDSKTVFF